MFNSNWLYDLAKQRQQDAERAAAAYRLALLAERTARSSAVAGQRRVLVGGLLRRITHLLLRRPAYSVTPKTQLR